MADQGVQGGKEVGEFFGLLASRHPETGVVGAAGFCCSFIGCVAPSGRGLAMGPGCRSGGVTWCVRVM
jgi:hypothetical protein